MHRAKPLSQQRLIAIIGRALLRIRRRPADTTHPRASIPVGRRGGVAVALRTRVTPRVSDHVLLIFRAGAPRQIHEPIVGRHIVEVPRLKTNRAWTDECLQDEVRDQPRFTARAPRQHHGPSAIGACARSQNPAAPAQGPAISTDRHAILGPDPALIRDGVQARPSDDGQPPLLDHAETVTNFADKGLRRG